MKDDFEERYQKYIADIKEDILKRRLLTWFWVDYEESWKRQALSAKIICPLVLISALISGVFRGNYLPKAALIIYALFIVSLIVYAIWVWKSLNNAEDYIGSRFYSYELRRHIEKRIHSDMVSEIKSIHSEMFEKNNTCSTQLYEHLQETMYFYERCLGRVDNWEFERK